MSTPDPTSATAGANLLGWPDMPPATDPLPEEPAYVLWSPTGQESVFSGGGATEPVGTRARLARGSAHHRKFHRSNSTCHELGIRVWPAETSP